jgi:hypothetical protein
MSTQMQQFQNAAGTNMIGDWWWQPQPFGQTIGPSLPANYCGRCGTYYYGAHLFCQAAVSITYTPAPVLTADDVKRLIREALDEHDKKSGDRLVLALEKLAAGVKTGGKK